MTVLVSALVWGPLACEWRDVDADSRVDAPLAFL